MEWQTDPSQQWAPQQNSTHCRNMHGGSGGGRDAGHEWGAGGSPPSSHMYGGGGGGSGHQRCSCPCTCGAASSRPFLSGVGAPAGDHSPPLGAGAGQEGQPSLTATSSLFMDPNRHMFTEEDSCGNPIASGLRQRTGSGSWSRDMRESSMGGFRPRRSLSAAKVARSLALEPWALVRRAVPIVVWCWVVVLVAALVGWWLAEGLLAVDEGSLGASGELVLSVIGQPESLAGGQFTVRMNTFRRNPLLKQAVDHMANCPGLAGITVIWSDQENDPPGLGLFSPSSRPLVQFEVHQTDSLNNRFKPLQDITTQAVLSIDDDVLIDCEDIALAFATWQTAPRTMVGFVPRLARYDAITGKHSYHKSWWRVIWNGVYNIVLTKAAFFHKDHMAAYNELPSEILEHVQTMKNCEDLAMSVVVARDSRSPPIWVRGHIRELDEGHGISAGGSHLDIRSSCLDMMAERLHGRHLRTSHVRVSSAKHVWWW